MNDRVSDLSVQRIIDGRYDAHGEVAWEYTARNLALDLRDERERIKKLEADLCDAQMARAGTEE